MILILQWLFFPSENGYFCKPLNKVSMNSEAVDRSVCLIGDKNLSFELQTRESEIIWWPTNFFLHFTFLNEECEVLRLLSPCAALRFNVFLGNEGKWPAASPGPESELYLNFIIKLNKTSDLGKKKRTGKRQFCDYLFPRFLSFFFWVRKWNY